MELTLKEQEALTKDLNQLLEKHNAEIGIVSTIQLLKKEEVKPEFITHGDTTKEEGKAD